MDRDGDFIHLQPPALMPEYLGCGKTADERMDRGGNFIRLEALALMPSYIGVGKTAVEQFDAGVVAKGAAEAGLLTELAVFNPATSIAEPIRKNDLVALLEERKL